MFFCSKPLSTIRLDGKTAVITGCNTGIGRVTAKDFYQRGAKVVMACRNVNAANQAAEDIKKERATRPNCGEIRVVELDLASLESVRECAKNLRETEDNINLLINNAGVMMCPYTKTRDGFEMQFGTNHLGPFLFTMLLLPKIIQSKPSRIVTVSSVLHSSGKIDLNDLNWEKKSYSAYGSYNQSKLANILFSKELACRLKEKNIEGVNTYSLHPGVVNTDLERHLGTTAPVMKFLWSYVYRPFGKTPEQGAKTTIYCATDENCRNETGLYYDECKVKKPSCRAENMEVANKLWEASVKLVNLEHEYRI